jgi:DNA modification methylase
MQKKYLTIPITKLRKNEANAKLHNDELIGSSIAELGYIDDIICDENFTILSGHGRLDALLRQNYEEVNVIQVIGLSEKQKRKYLLLANKSVESAGWEKELLVNFSEDELLSAGWESEELDEIFDLDLEEDDFEIEKELKKIKEPKIKLGDLYEIDEKHRFLCWDSRDPKGFEYLMGKNKFQLVFSSPPYNEGSGSLYKGNYSDNLSSDEFVKMQMDVLENCKKFLQGWIFWNINYNKNSRQDFVKILYKIVFELGLEFIENVTWDKGHGIPVVSREGLTRPTESVLVLGDDDAKKDLEVFFCGRNERVYFNKKSQRGLGNYWRISSNNSQSENHKAMFPVQLPQRAVELMTQRGDGVCDPYAGLMSTAVAVLKTSRVFYGIEISPLFLELGLHRIESLFHKKVKKVGNIHDG